MPAGRRRILMADIRLDMLPRRAARTIMLVCSLFARLARYDRQRPAQSGTVTRSVPAPACTNRQRVIASGIG